MLVSPDAKDGNLASGNKSAASLKLDDENLSCHDNNEQYK